MYRLKHTYYRLQLLLYMFTGSFCQCVSCDGFSALILTLQMWQIQGCRTIALIRPEAVCWSQRAVWFVSSRDFFGAN